MVDREPFALRYLIVTENELCRNALFFIEYDYVKICMGACLNSLIGTLKTLLGKLTSKFQRFECSPVKCIFKQ